MYNSLFCTLHTINNDRTYRFLVLDVCLFRSRSPVTNKMLPIIAAIRSTPPTTTPTRTSTGKGNDVTVSIVWMTVEAVLVVFGTKVFTALETSSVSDAAAAIDKENVLTVDEGACSGGGGGGGGDGDGIDKEGVSTVEGGCSGGGDDGDDGDGGDGDGEVNSGTVDSARDGVLFGCCVVEW